MSQATHRGDPTRAGEERPSGDQALPPDEITHGGDDADSQVPPRRLWIGRALGPVLALAVYFLLPESEQLPVEARTTAAIVTLVAVWWMSEAMPLPATALVPIVAFPLTGVLSTGDATAPYAEPTVFLFMGGFLIALAMQKWGLHKRIALQTIRLVGTKPNQLVLGVMIATAFLSMWVSNTATTLLMLPIGLSVLALVHTGQSVGVTSTAEAEEQLASSGPISELGLDSDVAKFGVCLMLAIAYAASIGGLATLIGSPPNLIMAGFVEQNYGIDLAFASWMAIGVPLAAVFLVIAWLLLTRVLYRSGLTEIAGGKAAIRQQLAELGPMSRGETSVLVVFVATALLWVFRQPLSGSETLTGVLPFLEGLSDANIAIAAAVVLFLLPVDARRGRSVLDWRTAQQGLPWGVLLLFGGGLSLAAGVQESGLDSYIGTQVSGLGALPTVLLVASICLVILMLTELTSNTATAATFLPVLGGVAIGIGVDPLLLLVPAALAATCAFMLPVGTPPNAIVFGSGYVTIGQMVRAGIVLNVVGVLLITAFVYALGGLAMGIAF